MTRRLLAAILALVLPLAGVVAPSKAQQAPLVVFVVDNTLETASVIDPGPDGLTRLRDIFQGLGARTAYIRLDEPIPAEAQVVVIVRPWRATPNDVVARLFIHIAHGGHVLWAVDPTGHVRSRADTSRGALAQLVQTDYGVQLLDGFVWMPWFSRASIAEQITTFAWSAPLPGTDHPVIQPLVEHHLPVMTWGARPVGVEPVGVESFGWALLGMTGGYGETNPQVFHTADPAPFELNLDADLQGVIPIAALAEQTGYGSRLALLGDSEIVQNNFGLDQGLDGSALYPGNRVLVERLAAWLLELPEDEWPDLPETFVAPQPPPNGPMVRITTTGTANLREEPTTEAGIVAQLLDGMLFAATGRNETGEWIRVQGTQGAGWVASFLLTPNVEIATLPVVAE